MKKETLVVVGAILLIVLMICGAIAYSTYSANLQKQYEVEKAKVVQQEKTERSSNRWKWLPDFRKE